MTARHRAARGLRTDAGTGVALLVPLLLVALLAVVAWWHPSTPLPPNSCATSNAPTTPGTSCAPTGASK